MAINVDEMNEIQTDKLKHFIPKRKYNHGARPTMASINSKWNPNNQQEIEEVDLSEAEKKQIIGAVIEIALKILFKNFTYKFGGKFFHQEEGGPIGVRATFLAIFQLFQVIF